MFMRKSLLLVATGVILLLTLSSCGGKKKESPAAGGPRASAPISVEAIQVKPRALASTLEVPGSLLPFEETEIRSEISGRIISLNLKEGQEVKKGLLLVKLFDEDLKAQLNKLKVQLEIALKTAERQRELLKINGISQQEYDLSELQVSNLRADMDLVRVNISKTEIHAPYDGRLGLKNISVGAYISPATLLTTISQVKKLKLQFTVPERYGSQVLSGQEVNFQLDGTNTVYRASVMATESTIEENTRSLMVRGIVEAKDAFLMPGAFAKVRMILQRQADALMIPSQAVIPQGRKKQVILFKNGVPAFTDITTGLRDSSDVQVLSGIAAGDTVITTGLLFIRPGSEVKIASIQ